MKHPPSSPEVAFLLACGRVPLDASGASAASVAPAGLDWSRVLALTSRHGLNPLVAWYVGGMPAEACPADVRETLRVRHLQATRHNLTLTAELFSLCDLFRNEGVEVIPFKGPVLAVSAYGDVSLRENGDLDLLVREASLERVQHLMARAGYEGEAALPAGLDATARTVAYALPFWKRVGDTPVLVELHWDVMPRYGRMVDFDVGAARARRTEVPVGNRVLPSLSPEDTVLLLCIHGCKHRWFALKWLVDLAAFAARQTIDWEVVVERATRAGARRVLGVSFRLAERLLGRPVPAPIAAIIRHDRRVEALAALVVDDVAEVSEPSYGQIRWFRAAMADRRRRRVRYLWDLATRPGRSEMERLRLPLRLAGVYRLYRLAVFARVAWNRLRRRPFARNGAGGEAPAGARQHLDRGDSRETS